MNLISFLAYKRFQVLLYNSHDLTSVICLQTVCSIWPRDRTLSGATTPGQSGPESNSNKEVLHIPQIFKAGALQSDGLMSYPGHSLVEGSYASAEMRSRLSYKRNRKDRYILGPFPKKMYIMYLTVSVAVVTQGMVPKGQEKRLEGQEISGWTEIIRCITLLISARILRRVLEIWGDLLALRFQ